jgi:hypothetical protein
MLRDRNYYITAYFVVIVFYIWTALFDGLPMRFGYPQKDYYSLLVHGFLKGHLSLDVEVPKALLDSKDPYDPTLRPAGTFLHDVSLYQGKYYIYFGAVPAIVLLLPFRVLFGVDLPIVLAILLFLSFSYAVLLLIIADCRKRFFSKSSIFLIFLICVALGVMNWAPVLLRRHSMYELAISSGQCFCMLALFSLYRSLMQDQMSLKWVWISSFCFGLAIGSRPTYILAPLSLFIIFFYKKYTLYDFKFPKSLKYIAASLIPLVVIGLSILLYNTMRFGNPLESGHKYQLSGNYEAKIQEFSFRYLYYNLFVYLLSPALWDLHFPFLHITPVLKPKPYQHYGMEIPFGLLRYLPLFWLIPFAFLGHIFKKTFSLSSDIKIFILVIIWIFTSTASFLLFFNTATSRYIGDVAPFASLLIFFGSGFILYSLKIKGFRYISTITVVVFAITTLFSSVLLSVGAYDRLKQFNPVLYYKLETTSDFIINSFRTLNFKRHFDTSLYLVNNKQATANTSKIVYKKYISSEGFIRFYVFFPVGKVGLREPLISTGRDGLGDVLLVEYLSTNRIRFQFEHMGRNPYLGSEMTFIPGLRYFIDVTYPSAQYSLEKGEMGSYHSLTVRVNGLLLWEEDPVSYPFQTKDLFIGINAVGSTYTNKIFTGTIDNIFTFGESTSP